MTAHRVRQSTLGQMLGWSSTGGQGRAATAAAPPPSDETVLAAFLLHQRSRGAASAWQPYLAVLPDSYDTLAYFSAEERALLPGHLQRAAEAQDAELAAAFARAEASWLSSRSGPAGSNSTAALFGPSPVTLADFRWAWFSVATRCVYVSDGGRDSCALAPVLDMLNHSVEADVQAGFNTSTRCYEIRSRTHSFRRGEQVFISYGPHDGATLVKE